MSCFSSEAFSDRTLQRRSQLNLKCEEQDRLKDQRNHAVRRIIFSKAAVGFDVLLKVEMCITHYTLFLLAQIRFFS